MIRLLALRSLTQRPWRTLFLLTGYALGVGVMVVLLSIGEALVAQSRDEKLVGGGDVTVLPEGIDIEVLKTGGLGGLFFSIENARFIYRQVLASPRLAAHIRGVAPQLEGKLLYLRPMRAGAVELPVRASGEIPSRSEAVGAAADLEQGDWRDDAGSRRWHSPTDAELRHDIDHFHRPPASAVGDESWGEWHYFNVLSADRQRWAFVTLLVGGAVPGERPEQRGGRWGGQVLVTLHEQGKPERRFVSYVDSGDVRFSTSVADLDIGPSTVRVLADGRYAVRAVAPAAGTTGSGDRVEVDLELAPQPRAYFPGATVAGGEAVSGYAVPALRGEATGRICTVSGGSRRCDRYERAQGYHDHNWGTWRAVTWEWGAFRGGDLAILYGRVEPDPAAATQPLFLYVVDSMGFLALFRPRVITHEDARVAVVGGRPVRVPARSRMVDVRGSDTIVVELVSEDASVTDMRMGYRERGDTAAARAATKPYFVQLKGTARIRGRIRGRPILADGAGFFETYR